MYNENMEDHMKIQSVIDQLRSRLVMEVDYDSIKLPVRNIITRMSANRIEAEKKSSEDRMMELLGVMSSSSRDDFEKFLTAAAQANMDVREPIADAYREAFGCPLVFSQVPVQESQPNDEPQPAGAAAPRDVYKMQEYQPYGGCLIINNKTFSNQHISERQGSDKDVERMENLFQKLGFQVDTKRDLTAEAMRNALQQHARNASTRYSVLAVVLMSHGGRHDFVYGSDVVVGDMANAISRDELMQFFTTSNCPAMEGKPKLFIVQACRGAFEDTRNNANTTQQPPVQSTAPVQHNETDSVPSHHGRHSETADMCFVYASSPGYVAYRDPNDGSLFVKIFSEYIRKHAATDLYCEIIRKIRAKFNGMEISADRKTLPEYMTTLTKELDLKLLISSSQACGRE